MRLSLPPALRPTSALMLVVAVAACGGAPSASPEGPAPASAAPAVFQPGAPGESARQVDAREMTGLVMPHTEADADFMRGMIHHHQQAVEMVDLLETRTQDRQMRQLALRIEISQRDEIGFMERWLEARDEDPPAMGGMDHAGMDHAAMGHAMPMMPGMLTPEQMAELEAAEGVAFDRLFLEYMIQHHDGAIVMVEELFASPGAGQEPEINRFATDVDADQSMEIQRMQAMLNARR